MLMRNKTFAAREHPHPNPLPQAGEGAGHCALSRVRERAGVRVVDQQSPSVSLRTPGAARGLGCSQRKPVEIHGTAVTMASPTSSAST